MEEYNYLYGKVIIKKCKRCGHTPFENVCNCHGKMYFEVACKYCYTRTGALPSRWLAAAAWNRDHCPDSFARWGYEIRSQEWGYEYVDRRSLLGKREE